MTLQEAIKILKEHNEWRRGPYDLDIKMVDPTALGVAIDLIVKHYESKTSEYD